MLNNNNNINSATKTSNKSDSKNGTIDSQTSKTNSSKSFSSWFSYSSNNILKSSTSRNDGESLINSPDLNLESQVDKRTNENTSSRKTKGIIDNKAQSQCNTDNSSLVDGVEINGETGSSNSNNGISTILSSFWSSKYQQSKKEVVSLSKNNGTYNEDLQKKKDIIPQEVYATLEPNKLYSEIIDLRNFELDKTEIRSTNYKSTTNVVVPNFEESLKLNSWANYLNSLIAPITNKIFWKTPTSNYAADFKILSHKTEQQELPNKTNVKSNNFINENRWFHPLLRNQEPNTKFHKILIIGVHGFFPTKILRPLLGEPTGTSFKFMLEAENTIKHWIYDNKDKFQNNSASNNEIQISKIALVKSDKVFNRVNYFIDVIKEQIPHLNEYDFIFVAAHSQGTPVSVMLMAQLVKKEILKLSFDKTIGILAMAGISNGPFYEMKNIYLVKAYSALESESLLELFEFQDFSTLQSSTYKKSLKLLLSNNVKIVYVGSVDDQLVPLYSSTCLLVNHPNVFRAIYVDTNSNTPNFLLRILSCALLLRNKGVNDHGMIKEMSNALAGPLTGGGHSRLYNEHKVYDLGLKFFLNTTNVVSMDGKGLVPSFTDFDVSKLGMNKYYLPWCLREFMYSTCSYIPDGKKHVKLMIQEFDEWNPDKKILKEIKQRMIPLKP